MRNERKKVRITVDLTDDYNQRLERLTDLIGAPSKADTIRDALKMLEYLAESYDDGYEFLRRKGDRLEVVPLFRIM